MKELDWQSSATDFIAEASIERSTGFILNKAARMTQGEGEPAAEYVRRMKLTLAMLPQDEVVQGVDTKSRTYRVSEEMEQLLAFTFCDGLWTNHPFKRRYSDVPLTLDEAFKAVAKYSEPNRLGIATEEELIIKAYQDSRGPCLYPRIGSTSFRTISESRQFRCCCTSLCEQQAN